MGKEDQNHPFLTSSTTDLVEDPGTNAERLGLREKLDRIMAVAEQDVAETGKLTPQTLERINEAFAVEFDTPTGRKERKG